MDSGEKPTRWQRLEILFVILAVLVPLALARAEPAPGGVHGWMVDLALALASAACALALAGLIIDIFPALRGPWNVALRVWARRRRNRATDKAGHGWTAVLMGIPDFAGGPSFHLALRWPTASVRKVLVPGTYTPDVERLPTASCEVSNGTESWLTAMHPKHIRLETWVEAGAMFPGDFFDATFTPGRYEITCIVEGVQVAHRRFVAHPDGTLGYRGLSRLREWYRTNNVDPQDEPGPDEPLW